MEHELALAKNNLQGLAATINLSYYKGEIMEVRWCFPQITGRRAGLRFFTEIFNDNPIKSLQREICQNSLDAAYNDNTVIVEFKTFSIRQTIFRKLNS